MNARFPFFVRRWFLGGAVVWAGCFGQPGTRAEEALGDIDHEPTGPNHRPGQPCLVCHGADYTPGGEVFAIAGTVYETPSSDAGLAGVEITVEDTDGVRVLLRSNAVGNFYLEGAQLHYPLRVAISYGEERVEMRSPILREGSCAHCHTREGPNEASEGRVYLRDHR